MTPLLISDPASFHRAPFSSLGDVCRLGFASHMNGRLAEADVHAVLDAGVNFLNWPGAPDYLSRAVAGLPASRRDTLRLCVQFEARTAGDAETELAGILKELRTDCVDLLTFYYVEAAEEWDQIIGPGGALEYCLKARDQGKIRMLGITSHQRPLAARIAQSGLIDMLMIRYNAAHRGAETEIFPITQPFGMPVVCYTSLRWGGLLEATPDDPSGFEAPAAPAWYRFVLSQPGVTVALVAPQDRRELDEDLSILRARPLSVEEWNRLAEHGARVRKYAGHFP
jgi:predicted aldo/keto reductase-like oxidoreductase